MSEREVPKLEAQRSPITTRPRRVRVGLLGCGVVGSAVARSLLDGRAELSHSAGFGIELTRVAVREPSKVRPVTLPPETLTTDALAVANDPNIDIVVEVIGGIEPARTALLAAIAAGKPVVTANKELLASASGEQIFRAAQRSGVSLGFEASIGGGIPLVRTLREALAGDRVRRVTAVVNGTTNYILTRMELRYTLQDALREAQAKGFAEADPTADLKGLDAAAKTALIASICFGRHFLASEVDCLGISGVSNIDVEAASSLGYSLRLVATVKEIEGQVSLRVQPTLLPRAHPLATLAGETNGFVLHTDSAGKLLLQGAGAGGDPTASAILGDLVSAARGLCTGSSSSTSLISDHGMPSFRCVAPSRRFIRIVAQRGGWRAKVRRTFERNSIGIHSSVTQTHDDEPMNALISEPMDDDTCKSVVTDLADHDVWPVSIYRVCDAA